MEARDSAIQFRHAIPSDIPELQQLIAKSVRELQAADHSPEQIEGALGYVFGVDSQLIADGTYFIAETVLTPDRMMVVGCGGWSMRKTLFGSDCGPGREPQLLDPATDAARIRAIFVHPSWARRGIGSKILAVCETAAAACGFKCLEMASTLTGVPLYQCRGYIAVSQDQITLANGAILPVVLMQKQI